MTEQEREELFKQLDEEALRISKSKGQDYGDKDVLSNFKNVSSAARNLGIDVYESEQYALFLVILKIARYCNLANNNRTPNHESVEDTLKDLIIYSKLAYCCYKEKQWN